MNRVENRLLLVGEFESGVNHSKLGYIRRGTVSYEYYWLDRWYNVFCFHEPSGRFRNYYCNLNLPPTFEDSVIDYVDLDIDVVVREDRSFEVLDREEFRLNTIKYSYPPEVVERTEIALEELLSLVKNREDPFNG